jgi:hypothetical protein
MCSCLGNFNFSDLDPHVATFHILSVKLEKSLFYKTVNLYLISLLCYVACFFIANICWSLCNFLVRSLDFSIDLILPTTIWPRGQLSLWQNRVPGIFLRVNGGRRVRLTTLPPYGRLSSSKCGSLDVSQPYGASAACYMESLIFLTSAFFRI